MAWFGRDGTGKGCINERKVVAIASDQCLGE